LAHWSVQQPFNEPLTASRGPYDSAIAGGIEWAAAGEMANRITRVPQDRTNGKGEFNNAENREVRSR